MCSTSSAERQEIGAPPSIALAGMVWKLAVLSTYGGPNAQWPESLREVPWPRGETGRYTNASNDYYFMLDQLNAGKPAVVWMTDTGPNE